MLQTKAPQEIVVTSRKVSCSGDEKLGLGHPKVYYIMKDDEDSFVCLYCNRTHKYIKPASNIIEFKNTEDRVSTVNS